MIDTVQHGQVQTQFNLRKFNKCASSQTAGLLSLYQAVILKGETETIHVSFPPTL